MIYVTVGLSTHVFDRLFKILDELCSEGIINGNELLVQAGYSQYESSNYKMVDMLTYEEQQKYIAKADFLIMHAGTGSIINSVRKNKKIILFPRLSEFHEHVDDHQLEISEFFSSIGCVLIAMNKEELIDCIKKIDKFCPKKFVSNNEHMNELLIHFIGD